MKFHEKIRSLRKQYKYTQQELANLLGVSLRTITNYESGERYPQRRELYSRLGEIFHVDPDYFLTERDEPVEITAPAVPSPDARRHAEELIEQILSLIHISEPTRPLF